jgi:hypothetical protein
MLIFHRTKISFFFDFAMILSSIIACDKNTLSTPKSAPCDDGYTPSFCELTGGTFPQGGLPGGFSPKDENDEEVKIAANFAVGQIKPAGDFKLKAISAAASQVVAGLNYVISMDISNGTTTERHRVQVFRSLDGKFSLSKDLLAQKN